MYTWLFTNKQINIDIATIVSIVLALFSIIISMIFYFKASETSNKFYNNSFHFMKEQSVLLGRIEERFGEKLGNVERILINAQGIGSSTEQINQKLKKEIEEKNELNRKLLLIESSQISAKEELVAKLEEKDRIIENLLDENRANNSTIQEYLNRIRTFNDRIKENEIYLDNFIYNHNSSFINIHSSFVELLKRSGIAFDRNLQLIINNFIYDYENSIGIYRKRAKVEEVLSKIEKWLGDKKSINNEIKSNVLNEIKLLFKNI